MGLSWFRRRLVRAGGVGSLELEDAVQKFRGMLEHFLYDRDTLFIVVIQEGKRCKAFVYKGNFPCEIELCFN